MFFITSVDFRGFAVLEYSYYSDYKLTCASKKIIIAKSVFNNAIDGCHLLGGGSHKSICN